MRKRCLSLILFLFVGVLLVGLQPALSQQVDANACPTLVQRAISLLGDNCNALDRNSVCYGFNKVDASFSETVDPTAFDTPADRVNLAIVRKIATAPLDTVLQQWGLAVMNVQANVPATLPGQAVTFIMMGETEIEDGRQAASGAGASSAPTAIVVTTLGAATIRSGPSESTSVLLNAPAGTALQSDSLSGDRGWLRVNTATGPGWINRNAVIPIEAIDTLQVEGSTAAPAPLSQSPMQTFYFRTAFNALQCQVAPSMLTIESPEGITVDLRANGAHIRIGSYILLRILPPGDIMQIIVVDGQAILEPGTPFQTIVPAGYSAQRCLSEPRNLGNDASANDREVYDACPWQPPVPMTDDEKGLAIIALAARDSLHDPSLDFGSQTPSQPSQPSGQTGTTCPTGQLVTHIVAEGENLYRISQRYNTTVNAIMAANNLSSTVIYPGQRLTVGCGVQGPSNPPSQQPPPSTGGVDCSRFQALTPAGAIPAGGVVIFAWSAAPGATSYRVNIGGQTGSRSFLTPGSQTSMAIDVSPNTIGSGTAYLWNVDALLNGRVVCGAQPLSITRSQTQGTPAPITSTPIPQASPTPTQTPVPYYTPTITPPEEIDCINRGGQWVQGEDGSYYCAFPVS